ncbi:uncharacterized protein SOCE26_041340 [Sorangium cellulosum]|uniref:Uncharacterized protein n=1 Tax=Sorangium cellulosum TaxID=56 RepID=A0A2L0ETS2_SORCE|nr:hypothetical protein [Sorangium cellulosum]AUX42701.1 uncharacterized protein SOCE26_041340 [Sorangium cellulosum]
MQQRSEPSSAVFEELSPIDELVAAPPPRAQGAAAIGAGVRATMWSSRARRST